MDYVVRLSPSQTRFQDFKHDLLDKANDYKNDDNPVLKNMWVVRRVVGQFLFYWPITEPLLEEMISAGLEALTSFEKWDDRSAMWNRVRHVIAVEINNHRSIVRASFSTNRKLANSGEPLTYGTIQPLYSVGESDDSFDMVDLVEDLNPNDNERYQQWNES